MDTAAERTRRFVALAFCRADLLFELDSEQKIVFAAGTTQHLLGKTPRELTNQFFPAFIDEASRGLVIELLDAAGQVFEWTSSPGNPGRYLVKGGSWDDKGCGVCRPAARHARPQNIKHILIGFRLVTGAE